MREILYLIFFLLALISSASYARTNALKLSDVFFSARKHFPLINAAQEDVNVARSQLLSARGSFDPKLLSGFKSEPDGGYKNYSSNTELSVPIIVGGARLYVGYRIGRGDWPIYFNNNLTNSGGELRYGLDVPLLQNFMIDPQRAGVRVSKSNIGLQQQSANELLIDTLNRAGMAYWRWVESARILEYSQQLLNLAIIRQKALLRRHHLGDVAHIESVENNRFIFQRKAQLVYAKQNYIHASINLSLYYRGKDGNPIIPSLKRVPTKYHPIPLRPIYISRWLKKSRKIIAANPLVKIFDREIEIQKIKLKLVKNQLMPSLDLKFESDKQYGSGGDPRLLPLAHTIALNFSVPLPRRQARGKFKEIQSSIRRLNLQKVFQREQLYAEFRSYLNELENDRRQFFYLHKEVKAAKQVEHAEMVRFKEGDSSLFLVNQREQTTFSARIRALQAEIAYYQSRVNLQRVCAFSCARFVHGVDAF